MCTYEYIYWQSKYASGTAVPFGGRSCGCVALCGITPVLLCSTARLVCCSYRMYVRALLPRSVYLLGCVMGHGPWASWKDGGRNVRCFDFLYQQGCRAGESVQSRACACKDARIYLCTRCRRCFLACLDSEQALCTRGRCTAAWHRVGAVLVAGACPRRKKQA